LTPVSTKLTFIAQGDMRLRKEREKAGLTQQELSKLAGVTQSTISKLESSARPSCRFETLRRLAAALKRRGRKVEAVDLFPITQPALIKGFRSKRKRRLAVRGREQVAIQ
jgi:transcriptional regulator with XRE-family HTH domain